MTGSIRADEIEVGDILWDTQRHVVVKITRLSVSVNVQCEIVGKPGTRIDWLLGNEWPVEVTRDDSDLQ